MELNEQLYSDPVVRAMLWCLISDDDLSAETLEDNGLSAAEAASILRDEAGRLRQLRLRLGIAARFNVAKLAALLRSRLAEHIEALQKSTELSGMLRSMKSLPVWLFPEWQLAAEKQDASLGTLLQLSTLTEGQAQSAV